MSATAASNLLSVSDYLLLPEGGPRYQLIEGDFVMAPSPRGHHQNITGRIFRRLCDWVEKNDAGVVMIAPFDVYLDDNNVYQPDVLFIAKARLDDVYQDDGVHGAPDLAVEVLSPGTARLDKDAKRRVYARAGVAEMWLIDPELRSMQIYRFAENPDRPVAYLELGDTLTTPLLPGFSAPLEKIYGA
jgi:Uma2 family endonuclease